MRGSNWLWITQQSAAELRLEASSPFLGPKKPKYISSGLWHRGSKSYQMGCGQHLSSCQHSQPHPCQLPLSLLGSAAFWDCLNLSSFLGSRPPAPGISPAPHSLLSNLDSHIELTRGRVAAPTPLTSPDTSSVSSAYLPCPGVSKETSRISPHCKGFRDPAQNTNMGSLSFTLAGF